MIKDIILWAVVVGLLSVIIWLSLASVEKSECLRWKEEAGKYPNYYLLKWQKEQCDHYGIDVIAPVYDYENKVCL